VELVVVGQHVLLSERFARSGLPNETTCSDPRLVRIRVPKKERVRGVEVFVYSETVFILRSQIGTKVIDIETVYDWQRSGKHRLGEGHGAWIQYARDVIVRKGATHECPGIGRVGLRRERVVKLDGVRTLQQGAKVA